MITYCHYLFFLILTILLVPVCQLLSSLPSTNILSATLPNKNKLSKRITFIHFCFSRNPNKKYKIPFLALIKSHFWHKLNPRNGKEQIQNYNISSKVLIDFFCFWKNSKQLYTLKLKKITHR